MGIVKLALIVLAMVFSAAPLPFSDELGATRLHFVWAASTIFYFVASDYFQVVRLKGFVEFWRIFRGPSSPRKTRALYLPAVSAQPLLSGTLRSACLSSSPPAAVSG